MHSPGATSSRTRCACLEGRIVLLMGRLWLSSHRMCWMRAVALRAGSLFQGIQEGHGFQHAVGASHLHSAAHVANGHRRIGHVLVRQSMVVRCKQAPVARMYCQGIGSAIRCAATTMRQRFQPSALGRSQMADVQGGSWSSEKLRFSQ